MDLRTWVRLAAVKYLEGMARTAKDYHRNAWSSYPGQEERPGPVQQERPAEQPRGVEPDG